VRGGQHAFGVDGQRHWRTEGFGEAGQRGRGIDGAAAGENQRALGARQQLSHLLDRRGCGTGARDADRLAAQQCVGVFHQHIQRDLDMHRPRTAGLEQCKCPCQHPGQLRRRHQGMGERRHARDHRALVRQFMQLAAPAAQLAA